MLRTLFFTFARSVRSEITPKTCETANLPSIVSVSRCHNKRHRDTATIRMASLLRNNQRLAKQRHRVTATVQQNHRFEKEVSGLLAHRPPLPPLPCASCSSMHAPAHAALPSHTELSLHLTRTGTECLCHLTEHLMHPIRAPPLVYCVHAPPRNEAGLRLSISAR